MSKAEAKDSVAWMEPKRDDENDLPIGKSAVKIIPKIHQSTDDTAATSGTTVSSAKNYTRKSPVTKIAKLIYEPKTRVPNKPIYTYTNPKFKQAFGRIEDDDSDAPYTVKYTDKIKTGDIAQRQVSTKIARITNLCDIIKDDNTSSKREGEEKISTLRKTTEELSEEFQRKKIERNIEAKEFEKELLKNINEIGREANNVNKIEEINRYNSHLPMKSTKVENLEIPPLSLRASSHEDIDRHRNGDKLTNGSISTRRSSSSLQNVNSVRNNLSSIPSKSSLSLSRRSLPCNSDVFKKTSAPDCDVRKNLLSNQRKKRSTIYATSKGTKTGLSKIEKEEIKKRLENLRKDTQKILTKNVKKVRKSSNIDDKKLQTNEEILIKQKTTDLQRKPSSNARIPESPKTRPVRRSTKSPAALHGPENKVGLLRMSEDECLAFANLKSYDMNKENIIFNTPQITQTLADKITPKEGIRKILEDERAIAQEKFCSSSKELPPMEIPKSTKSDNQCSHLNLNTPSIGNNNRINETDSRKSQDAKLLNESERNFSRAEPNLAELLRHDKETQFDETPSQTKPDKDSASTAYWLKPTSVQMYPYNFIMAVRKKLEAISNPPLSIKNDPLEKTENAFTKSRMQDFLPPKKTGHDLGIRCRLLSRRDQESINHPEHESDYNALGRDNKLSTASSLFTAFVDSDHEYVKEPFIMDESQHTEKYVDLHAEKFEPNSLKTSIHLKENENKKAYVKGKMEKTSSSISELMSNFSSITIQMPFESNTASEVSSICTESIRPTMSRTRILKNKATVAGQESDTTISSAIYSSPERQMKNQKKRSCREIETELSVEEKLSPLSTQHIDRLNLKVPRTLPDSVNPYRGDGLDIPPHRLIPKSSTSRESKRSKVYSAREQNSVTPDQTNMEQLLQAFNKSLSQVLEVNQQLNMTINRPVSSTVVKPPSSTDNYYSSDFEEYSKSSSKSRTSRSQNSNSKHSQHLIQSQIVDNNSAESLNEKSRTDTATLRNNKEVPSALKSLSSNSSLSIPTELSAFGKTRNQPHQKLSNDVSFNSEMVVESPKSNITRNGNTSELFVDSIEDLAKSKQHSTEQSNPSDDRSIEDKHFVQVVPETETGLESNGCDLKLQTPLAMGTISESKENQQVTDEPPPGYTFASASEDHKINNVPKQATAHNSTLGSDILAAFSQSEIDLSLLSHDGSCSEANLSYSSIGMYEKLISTEASKSEYLTALLKMREKALLDRTRGQIAWLEVQKEKLKANGLISQISAIKKKQRAILLKLERERQEIKKLMRSSERGSEEQKRSMPQWIQRKLLEAPKSDSLVRRSVNVTISHRKEARVLKGFEIEANRHLELMLQRREEQLKRRRDEVERLCKWHQRLDKEEDEVLKMEQMLFKFNRLGEEQIQSSTRDAKIAKIDRSLKVLNNISTKSTDSVHTKEEYVRTSGADLNKLWRRLTGRPQPKFEPSRKYKLTKIDLERLYECAKKAVLKDFGRTDEMRSSLLEMSIGKRDRDAERTRSGSDLRTISEYSIPSLNLSFTSAHSENDKTKTDVPPETSRSTSVRKRSGTSEDSDYYYSTNTEHSDQVNNNLQQEICSDHSSSKRSDHDQKSTCHTLPSTEKPRSNEETDSGTIVEEDIVSTESRITLTEIPINNASNISKQEYSSKFEDDLTTGDEISSSVIENSQPKPTSIEKSESEILSDVAIFGDMPSTTQTLPDLEVNPSNAEAVGGDVQLENEKSPQTASLESIDAQRNSTENSFDDTISEQSDKCSAQDDDDVITKEHEIFESSSDTIILVESKSKSTSSILEQVEESGQQSTTITSSINTESKTKTDNNYENSSKDVAIKAAEEQSAIEELLTEQITEAENKISLTDLKEQKILEGCTFENSLENNTLIDNITQPSFSDISIVEESVDNKADHSFVDDEDLSSSTTSELEKRLIDIDDTLKDLQQTFERVLSPDKCRTPSPTSPSSPKHPLMVADQDNFIIPSTSVEPSVHKDTPKSSATVNANSIVSILSTPAPITPATNGTDEVAANRMPDIISEVDIRHRQHVITETELKQFENAVPYVFLREIPNKPPPPYVPPAHGSPMTTIFPSEKRIQEITFRRIRELYDEMTCSKLIVNGHRQSILDENITNIYERIILDICKEYMQENTPLPSIGLLRNVNGTTAPKAVTTEPSNYTKPLAFYNPPNRLKCMQEHAYKRVRKLLAMDKQTSTRGSLFSFGRRKRDHVDEILIQELFEEEYKWTNFEAEECEVHAAIVDEITNDLVTQVVENFESAYNQKKIFLKQQFHNNQRNCEYENVISDALLLS